MKKFLVFKSTTCGPCKMVTPIVESIKEENPDLDISIYFTDSDEGNLQAMSYGVSAVPTFIKIDEDGSMATIVGYRPKQALEQFFGI